MLGIFSGFTGLVDLISIFRDTSGVWSIPGPALGSNFEALASA